MISKHHGSTTHYVHIKIHVWVTIDALLSWCFNVFSFNQFVKIKCFTASFPFSCGFGFSIVNKIKFRVVYIYIHIKMPGRLETIVFSSSPWWVPNMFLKGPMAPWGNPCGDPGESRAVIMCGYIYMYIYTYIGLVFCSVGGITHLSYHHRVRAWFSVPSVREGLLQRHTLLTRLRVWSSLVDCRSCLQRSKQDNSEYVYRLDIYR